MSYPNSNPSSPRALHPPSSSQPGSSSSRPNPQSHNKRHAPNTAADDDSDSDYPDIDPELRLRTVRTAASAIAESVRVENKQRRKKSRRWLFARSASTKCVGLCSVWLPRLIDYMLGRSGIVRPPHRHPHRPSHSHNHSLRLQQARNRKERGGTCT